METVAVDQYLRTERLPHIWCAGCGIGIAMRAMIQALAQSGLKMEEVAVVSGIGCSGRVAGYMKVDSFHTTHGRAIPFATGLKLANPKLKVIVFSGDGDLFTIGGNHFIHAARRNMDMTVICVNNFIYGMTGGQFGSSTPSHARTTTSPYGNVETPFNLPYLAMACGAAYVARWTTYHVIQLIGAMKEALARRGFTFVEVVSPCPTVFGSRNDYPTGLLHMKYFKANSDRLKDSDDPSTTGIELGGKIKVGKFYDKERPSFMDRLLRETADETPAERNLEG
jgi:2-oxoglutarate ferredoxin oxidoreductase subunit beta